MPGQLCDGSVIKNAELKNSKAYCEGRDALHKFWPGAAQNPHQPGSDANVAWKAGYDSVEDPLGTPGPRDCCAIPSRHNT